MELVPNHNFGTNELFVDLPPFYIIEPTNYCNYRCIMCPNRLYKEKDLGYMNLELFRKIIDEISQKAIFIQLYWMGEPLLNNNIFYMIQYIKKNTSAKVILSTNGSLLTQQITKLLCESNLDKIIISLDAIESQEIYSKIRCGGNLKQVINNVEFFLQHNASIDTILQMLCFKLNRGEKEKMEKRFGQYNYLTRFSWLDTWAGSFPSIADIADEVSPLISVERKACTDLWYKATIHWDGSLALCCHDWNWKIKLGNVSERSLMQLWNSEKMQELRSLHIRKCFDQILLCRNCREWAVFEEYQEFM